MKKFLSILIWSLITLVLFSIVCFIFDLSTPGLILLSIGACIIYMMGRVLIEVKYYVKETPDIDAETYHK